MLLGMPVIWRPRSSTRLNVALAVFTLPAVVVALVAPAVLRVLVNLG
jgi:hypothetical protein